MMSEKERMLAGKLYIADDPKLIKDFKKARALTRRFNNSTEEQTEYRKQLLQELFEATGENIHIEPPFRCDYGNNITVGENFYANFDCIILDVCKVKIGQNVMFGPRVNIFTAGHPIDAEVRNTQLEYGKPVTIGDNVWVGGNVVINLGVSIGDNAVIGSGAVVTKDIPPNVVAVGNPCRILREITAEDKNYWANQRAEYFAKIAHN